MPGMRRRLIDAAVTAAASSSASSAAFEFESASASLGANTSTSTATATNASTNASTDGRAAALSMGVVHYADAAFSPTDVLRVTGILSVTLYGVLALAALYMMVQHCFHGSSRRKRAFHALLLLSVVLNIPDPIIWIAWPATERWIYIYPLHIFAMLAQSICKGVLSIFWSEVVVVGQSLRARRHATLTAKGLNCLVIGWGVAVPILLGKYSNDITGRLTFLLSSMRSVLAYVEVGIVLVYAVLLTYQGARLRTRLLLVRGTLPAASVDKSLSQLLLSLCVILLADAMHVAALVLYQLQVNMPFPTFVIISNLAPTIFPTICMLYLMRRFQASSNKDTTPAARPVRSLSRFMVDDPNTDSTSSMAPTKFVVPPTTDWQRQHRPLETDPNAPQSPMRSLSPSYTWRRG